MQQFLKWLAPNGIGTKFALAALVLAYALPKLEPQILGQAVIAIIGFYFLHKAATINGNGTPKA